MSQHEPLHNRDAQEAREARADKPMTAADLSPLEREALALLRKDEPRDLKLVAMAMRNPELERYSTAVTGDLWEMGLVRESRLSGFYTLTAEGARLQAELTGGGE